MIPIFREWWILAMQFQVNNDFSQKVLLLCTSHKVMIIIKAKGAHSALQIYLVLKKSSRIMAYVLWKLKVYTIRICNFKKNRSSPFWVIVKNAFFTVINRKKLLNKKVVSWSKMCHKCQNFQNRLIFGWVMVKYFFILVKVYVMEILLTFIINGL